MSAAELAFPEPPSIEAFSSDTAMDFLAALPHAYHNLVAISPRDGAEPVGITRPTGNDDLRRFIEKHLATSNLYFSANEPRPTAPDAKLPKTEIGTIRMLYADLDPDPEKDLDDERRKLFARVEGLQAETDTEPTFVVDSGGGLQLLWVVEEGLPNTDEARERAESQGRGIAKALGGDAVQNLDRIMRLPGTRNLPNAKKRARGRVEARTSLVPAEGYLLPSLDTLAIRYPPMAEAKSAHEDPTAVAIDMGAAHGACCRAELSGDLQTRLDALEAQHPTFADFVAGKAVAMVKNSSTSDVRFGLAGFLRANGFSVDDFAQFVMAWPTAHSDAWAEAGDSTIKRDLQRCWANCASDLSKYQAKSKADDDFDAPTEDEMSTLPSASAGDAGRFKFEFFETAKTDLRRRSLIKGLLLRVGTLGIIGAPGTGKSQLEAHLAYSIAAGVPWCGRKVEPGAVICALGEGAEGFRGRIQALRQVHGSAAIPFITVPTAPNLLQLSDVKIFVSACRDVVASFPGSPAVRMVIVDTLTAATPGGDQNATDMMSRVVGSLRYISQELDCVAAVVHHVGKDATRGARGSSVFNGDLDTELTIEATASDRFRVIQTKQREFEKGAPLRFIQRQAIIGQDADGDDVTAVYAEHDASPANDDFDTADVTDDTALLAAVQTKVAAADWAKDVQSGDWVGKAVAAALGIDTDMDATTKARIQARIRAWIKDGFLKIEAVRNPKAARDRPMVRVGVLV